MKGRWWNPQRFGGALFTAFSVFYGWRASYIESLPVDALEAMNARSLPFALALTGALLGLWLLVFGSSTQPVDAATTPTSETVDERRSTTRRRGQVVALLVATALFGGLLPVLGFALAAFAFLCLGFVVLGERHLVRIVAVAGGTTLVLYALLRWGLGVYFAPGTLWSTLGV